MLREKHEMHTKCMSCLIHQRKIKIVQFIKIECFFKLLKLLNLKMSSKFHFCITENFTNTNVLKYLPRETKFPNALL